MADIYVRSTDGSDADNGSTWALAKATITGAAAIDAAGDNIWLSQNHAESTASAITLSLAGTQSNPSKVLCGNDANEPPTSVTTGASIATTGSSTITVNGAGYFEGITFSCGTGAGSTNLLLAQADGSAQIYKDCKFILGTTSTSSKIVVGYSSSSNESHVYLINPIFKFGHASQGLSIGWSGTVVIVGGGIDATGSSITSFISSGSIPTNITSLKVIGFDFSNAASTFNILPASTTSNGTFTFTNCKLPSSWSGGLIAGAAVNANFRASLYNCWYSNINYSLWIETYSGTIRDNATVVKTGGSSDGTTALSWKMTTNANANEYVAPLVSDDMAVWIDTTGSSKTITVDIVHDSTTALTDAEVWLEVNYLGSSTTPLGTQTSDKRATVLTTAADQTTSSATWTTTGLTNPNKQKLEVTFTPQMKGFVYARACLAKPSYTVYVDYEPTIS